MQFKKQPKAFFFFNGEEMINRASEKKLNQRSKI